MTNIKNELKVVAQLMECESLDEASKEFIQTTVIKAAHALDSLEAKKQITSITNSSCIALLVS
ncbi:MULTISPECIES: hypothetical protein [Vibrio harveyi group]|uniref:hypothetical protein n=1 Tax=Vibrio harveyi group TaxID=717610 RepID=UPI0011103FE7|nr:hypothetical protein [Vibrio parahaemolyticus]MDG2761634.1 hypothetical protein [Vibrio parahaemolyticus]TMX40883.1 hypothetical protein DA098_03365 [Vibrio parahaemolyticus]TMX79812.1 hypothetical protein DA094_04835 [Vibrio parahaemolyticus]TMX80022.1 hypothetical protein DA094_04595 [Vibrio parahaemolyticus]